MTVSQNVKCRVTIWSWSCAHRCIFVIIRHISIQRTCTCILIAPLFIIAPKWKKPACLLTDEWGNEIWNIVQWKIIWPLKTKWSTDPHTCYSVSKLWKHYGQSKKVDVYVPILYYLCTWSIQNRKKIHRTIRWLLVSRG